MLNVCPHVIPVCKLKSPCCLCLYVQFVNKLLYFAGENCFCRDWHGCIMAQSIVGAENVQPYKFSECSKSDYEEALKAGRGICLFNKPNEVRITFLIFYFTSGSLNSQAILPVSLCIQALSRHKFVQLTHTQTQMLTG